MTFLKTHVRLIFILLLVALVFSPTLSQGIVSWDDEGHLLENVHVRSLNWDNIQKIFQSSVNRTYIPLTIFSFALEHHWAGYKPFVYHLNNLLLHLGVVALVYVLALRLGYPLKAAALAAFLFGVHPMHVESVAWVTQRKDVLYSFFYLLSLICYVGYVKDRRASSLAWALVCGLLSILAKPMAMSLPLVLFLLDWFLKRRWTMGLLWEKVPFVATIFPIAWWTYALNMRTVDLSFPQAPLTWLWSLAFYISKFFFPTDLSILYQLPQPVSWAEPAFISAVGLVLIVLWVLYRLRRQRLLIFAAAYFFLSIFFLLRFDSKQDLTFVADRFMYLPSLGICIAAGVLLERTLEQCRDRQKEIRQLITTIVAMFFVVLGVLSFERAKDWKDDYTLWSPVLRWSTNGVAYNQMGNYFLEQKDYPRALEYYSRAVYFNPQYHKPHGNRGLALFRMGRYDEAIAHFTKVIELVPDDAAIAYNNRGFAYWRLGEFEKASEDYDRAVALKPDYALTYLNRATLYKDMGDFGQAMADLKQVLRIDPQNEAALNNSRLLEKMMNNAAQ